MATTSGKTTVRVTEPVYEITITDLTQTEVDFLAAVIGEASGGPHSVGYDLYNALMDEGANPNSEEV